MPAELKQRSSTLQSLWSLLVPLLQRQPAHFFLQTTLLPPTLPPLLLPLITALHSHTRTAALTSIELTYTRIAVNNARTLLGLADDDGRGAWEALVRERGWEVEEEEGGGGGGGGGVWVRPKRAGGRGKGGRGVEGDGLGLSELSSLTRFIVQLEQ